MTLFDTALMSTRDQFPEHISVNMDIKVIELHHEATFTL